MAVVCRFKWPIEGVLINEGLLGVQWNVILVFQMVSSGPFNVLPSFMVSRVDQCPARLISNIVSTNSVVSAEGDGRRDVQ